jgi:hypothetical protein
MDIQSESRQLTQLERILREVIAQRYEQIAEHKELIWHINVIFFFLSFCRSK